MKNYVTDAINLNFYNLSESDKIVVMYSKDKGLMKCVAKGVKKPKSKLGGRMDFFINNRLLLNKGRNLDTICQAEAINSFKNLRTNMDKFAYSMYLSEIVASFGIEDDPNSKEIYDIFYKALDEISNADNKIEVLLKVIRFQLKIMKILGYQIELDYCVKCNCKNNQQDWAFSELQGGIICPECASSEGYSVKLFNKLREFLKTMTQVDFNEKTFYDELANEKVCIFCFRLLKNYIQSKSEKKFKTIQMLEMV